MSSEQQDNKPVKKLPKWAKITIWVAAGLLVLSALGIGGLQYVRNRLNQMQFTDKDLEDILNEEVDLTEDEDEKENLPSDTEKDPAETPAPIDLGNDEEIEVAERVPAIKNYLLLGVDSRKAESFAGLSDVMILVTIDTQNKAIKLTSYMRDILVQIEGWEDNRLNVVCKIKGPEETVKTIENMSGIKIDGYGIVNFYTVAKIVDILGGVDVENLSAEEIKDMNHTIDNMNKFTEEKGEHVKEPGAAHLTGMQAVAYMRVRHVGRGDYERTERQRTVMSTLFSGLKKMNFVTMMKVVNDVTPLVKTNLSASQILELAGDVYSLRHCDVQQMRIPIDDAHYMTMYNDFSVIIIDKEANAKALHEFIYGTK